MKFIKITKFDIGVVLLSFTFFFLSALPTTARAGAPIGDYFGGKVGYSQICSCSGMVLLYVYDYATKAMNQTMYIPGLSKLDAYFNIWSYGQYTMGGVYWAGMPCMIYVGEDCVTVGYAWSIVDATRGVGTSEY